MKPRLIIIFACLVLVPLGLLAGLGFTLARGERQRLESHLRALWLDQLKSTDEAIYLRILTQRWLKVLEFARQTPPDPELLRAEVRKTPWLSQFFILEPDGRLSYPDPHGELSDGERDFLVRTRELWTRGDAFRDPASIQLTPEGPSRPPVQPDNGWYSWYWGRGLHVLVWVRRADGRLIGAELDRMRLLADIIALLPDTGAAHPSPDEGRIRLLDTNNEILYQWGAYEPWGEPSPVATLALTPPLSSWRLEYFVPARLLSPGRSALYFNLLAGLAAAGAALAGLAFFFYRENTRELREAAQRVSFVSQVSHELKTPLTNIRLYAELLQERLTDEDETTGRHLGVIVGECERLSRLIGNVLTFSAGRRNTLRLHLAPLRVEEAVRRVVGRFEPGLTRRGIQVTLALAPAPEVRAAGDAIEQILGNLLGNVEKYAAAGGVAEIECRYAEGETILTVVDRGPGIPPAEREKIFEPFYRVSSALTEGVSGAGIGLAIARELARLHGGELRLVDSETGARFEVRLKTPPLEEDVPEGL